MTEEKHFDDWIDLKERLHNMNRLRTIHENEVWWCAMGENVGVEINRKSSTFARPVLIFKKLSRYGSLGIPLTSKPHQGSWYAPFRFQGRNQVAVLAQIRVICRTRINNPQSSWGWAGKSRIYSYCIKLLRFCQ